MCPISRRQHENKLVYSKATEVPEDLEKWITE